MKLLYVIIKPVKVVYGIWKRTPFVLKVVLLYIAATLLIMSTSQH